MFMLSGMAFATERNTAEPAVTFLVRHAEKAGDSKDPPLTAAGRQRAAALAALLGDAGIRQLYSTDFERTRETARPLAERLGVEVTLYDWDQMYALARQLQAPGTRSLVVGHSDTTPELVELLGGEAGAAIDEAAEYDRLYVLTRIASGETTTVLLRYPR